LPRAGGRMVAALPVCDHWRVFGDDADRESFEELVRSIAREVSRSVEGVAENLEEIAGSMGVDPELARRFVDGAGQWLRGQVGGFGDDAFRGAWPGTGAMDVDPLRGAGPHPLDMPSEEQGVALAALESGRWKVEPGTSTLVADGGGPGPRVGSGLVGELRARDWIAAEGGVTQVGRHALARWLDATDHR
jgi:hypothetical protein